MAYRGITHSWDQWALSLQYEDVTSGLVFGLKGCFRKCKDPTMETRKKTWKKQIKLNT